MRNHLKMLSAAVAVALAHAAAYAYTPVRHDGTYTTNGVTYAQRGGLGSADYVVTNVDASAVGRVRSVNGMVGDVVIDAEGVGAVARDADYLAVSNKASNAVQKTGDTMSGNLTIYSGIDGVAKGVRAEYSGAFDAFTEYRGDLIARGDKHEQYYYEYYFPDKSGTIALKSDIPTTMPWGSITGKPDIPTMGAISNVADSAAGLAYTNANAYTDASISETNDAFVAAVHAASPPVVLPQKWALANVTNANGGAVTAADVGAAGAGEVVKLTGDQSIGGSKTFETSAYFNRGLAAPSTIAVYGQDSGARFEVDNIMTGDYVYFGVGDFLDIGFDYTKRGNSYRVDLPERSGVLSVEGWASTYRALNEATTNDVTCAQLCGAIEKATESKPHFAIIDGEVHIISITP